jgi:hypothetical protein
MRGVAKCSVMAGVVLLLAAGCRTMTGQSLGQNVDDKTTTAAVKTDLARANLRNLTWVDVDTVRGTVYLHGTTTSQADKDRATQIARAASGSDRVVNNIQVVPNATTESHAGRSTAAARPSAARSSPGAQASEQAAMPQNAPAASPATGSTLMDLHSVTGSVTSVDHDTGHVTLQTSRGPMSLYFPPSALARVQRGEQVTVDLGLRPAPR